MQIYDLEPDRSLKHFLIKWVAGPPVWLAIAIVFAVWDNDLTQYARMRFRKP